MGSDGGAERVGDFLIALEVVVVSGDLVVCVDVCLGRRVEHGGRLVMTDSSFYANVDLGGSISP